MAIFGPFGSDNEIGRGGTNRTALEYDGDYAPGDVLRNYFGSGVGHAAIEATTGATSRLPGWAHYEVTDPPSLTEALQDQRHNYDAVVIRPGNAEVGDVRDMISTAHVAGAAIALVVDPALAANYLEPPILDAEQAQILVDVVDSTMLDHALHPRSPLPALTTWFHILHDRLEAAVQA